MPRRPAQPAFTHRFLSLLDQKSAVITMLVLTDSGVFIASAFAAYYLRNNYVSPPIHSFEIYTNALPVAVFLLITIFYLQGLYERRIRLHKISEIYRILKANTQVMILIMAAAFLYKFDYSRGMIVAFWLISSAALVLGRMTIRAFQKRATKKGIGLVRTIVIGSGSHAHDLKTEIERFTQFGYVCKGVHSASTLEKLPKLIRSQNINEVYIADTEIPHEKVMELITTCEHLPVKFKIVTDMFKVISGKTEIHHLEGIPAVDLKKQRPKALYRIAKKTFDLISSAILLILLAPFFLVITILIKLDSPGPAIFSHKRVGKDGTLFILHKFRTMNQYAKRQDYCPQSSKDPRITKVGRLLRKTSLDELPQLWNVLKGDMSLVGPRPEMPFIVETYTPWQRQRLLVKPGITGLWQILGRKDLPLHENLEYDLFYIHNQSFLLDIVILLKTVGVVITGKGAY